MLMLVFISTYLFFLSEAVCIVFFSLTNYSHSSDLLLLSKHKYSRNDCSSLVFLWRKRPPAFADVEMDREVTYCRVMFCSN